MSSRVPGPSLPRPTLIALAAALCLLVAACGDDSESPTADSSGDGETTTDSGSDDDTSSGDDTSGDDTSGDDDAPPELGADELTVPRDWVVTFDVLDNDGPVPASAEIVIVAEPEHGEAVATRSAALGRAVRYRPGWRYSGADSFRYRVVDGFDVIGEAEVTVTVEATTFVEIDETIYQVEFDGLDAAPAPDGDRTAWWTVLRDVADDGRALGHRRLGSDDETGWIVDAGSHEDVGSAGLTRLLRFEGSSVLGVTRVDDALEGFEDTGTEPVLRWSVAGALETRPVGRQTDGAMVLSVQREGGSSVLLENADSTVAHPALDGVDARAYAATGDLVVGELATGDGLLVDGATVTAVPPADGADQLRIEDVVDGDQRLFVGSERSTSGRWQAFLATDPAERFALVLPNALDSWAHGANDAGDVVGSFRDVQGFVRAYRLRVHAVPEGQLWAPAPEPDLGEIDHACGHARSGPFEGRDAATSPELASDILLDIPHIAYRVRLVDEAAVEPEPSTAPELESRDSWLTLTAMRNDQNTALLFNHPVSIRVFEADGTPIEAVQDDVTSGCENIVRWAQFQLPEAGGDYRVVLGGAALDEVQVVLEHTNIR